MLGAIGVMINCPKFAIMYGPKYPWTAPASVPTRVPAIKPLHVTPSPTQRTPFLSDLPKSRGKPPPKRRPLPFEKYAGSMK